ncbi:68_t:CDS:2 [Funneliformis geosporum]|uniref:16048_t:CDS:1 n=1 Tax=Funneliformis geosporum TaxID=1117311 RepID=A0A9W4WYB5_9GLOM|nr:68_t:CDS:2 [Funneliformis geosporum]CAI2188263.1 16048_t:CDS:2 [Funneliformis geosporum]
MDKFENESDYLFPNDTHEANRLRMQHYVSRFSWKGTNFNTPLKKEFKAGGLRVLDVGCGSGGWLFDMSYEYPNCTFVGIDISTTINEDIRPKNLGFIQCNALHGLPFFENTFDFVFQGNMFMTWKESDWPIIIKDMLRCVKSNGWIEIMEGAYDFRNVGHTMKILLDATQNRFISKGINLNIKPCLKGFLEATGELKSKVIINEAITPLWGSNLGAVAFKLFRKAHTSIEMHKYMGISQSTFEEMFDVIAQEVEENQTYVKIHRIHAQKK